jgi:hypothetical protein
MRDSAAAEGADDPACFSPLVGVEGAAGVDDLGGAGAETPGVNGRGMGKVRISKYLSIQQAKQLMAAVPESDYGAIGEGVDVLRYGGVLDNVHPLAE